ncbi:hypothetical protein BN6_39430 [Saccharothrix espanaensis DSM 44229]|uniref:Uncharacterized protein n=1 Tax=Saccharothrix espanaensis (strain ATCC 51144 / DSM 44229 / JCM 9112 / NBRC 15066 / NRRL 15764) TaxID=1179773 RepID=K0JYM1_SACES|nr:hypothetical protein BN6_39430 [Saccharothrix espanaensis DSM 44229]
MPLLRKGWITPNGLTHGDRIGDEPRGSSTATAGGRRYPPKWTLPEEDT